MSEIMQTSLPGDEHVILGLKDDEEWKYAWARAVAKAWECPQFRELLLTDAETAVREFGYKMPLGTKLKVENYAGDNAFQEEKGLNGWAHFKNELASEVIMVLPPTPQLEKRAIALADYQATGRTYPFSTI
ncbi:BMA_0021/BMA_0022 family TOMM bacteriocin [Psychromonas ossibalaenae]|uniref:BMA_0021/BMA_0022 family TOMM bacteriocin n=1 Tax=Psychromonas ossibalaenae TaxID=444922 RepID=UPI0003795AEC|nr:BMA_0021/BMA_0022 family TOMM bacteriocin [Psychromonas ossibalaenae]